MSSKPPIPPKRLLRPNDFPKMSSTTDTGHTSNPETNEPESKALIGRDSLVTKGPQFQAIIEHAKRAHLYLLQQQADPTRFTIRGDKPELKFEVGIGPQSCSCGESKCVHLFFVMLRVLRVDEGDPILLRPDLEPAEVENLLTGFQNRQNRPSQEEDKLQCPICLNEFVDGESLIVCTEGCKFHGNCMEIWLDQCTRDGDPLNCPQCQSLVNYNLPTINPSSQNSVGLLPAEYSESANKWKKFFDEQLLSCVFSGAWATRTSAFQRISEEFKKRVSCSLPTASEDWTTRELPFFESAFQLLAIGTGDPAFRVFEAAVECLQHVLAHLFVETKETRQHVQNQLVPVVQSVVRKAADGNRWMNSLASSTIVELCKGQEGNLRVGASYSIASIPVGGWEFGLHCLLGMPQSIFGVLICLHEVFVHLTLHSEQSEKILCSVPQLERIVQLCLSSQTNMHMYIRRQAINVLERACMLALSDSEKGTLVEAWLADVDPSLRMMMKKIPSRFTSNASNSPGDNMPARPRGGPLRNLSTPDLEELYSWWKLQVEIDEADALDQAIAQSLRPDALPPIPGLRSVQDAQGEELVYVEPNDDNDTSVNGDYREDIEWQRGQLLGTGAFSSCYQARDTITGTLMAVKQISFCRNSRAEQERLRKVIQEEITLLSTLSHPNIIRMYGATQQGTHFNLFIEWMAGGSLAYLIKTYGHLEELVALKYGFQVFQGIAYLHEKRILHRDLKGANLLLDNTAQRIRITDFGVSAKLRTNITVPGEFQNQLMGTVAFMAPEVLRGEHYGRGCDIWSIGCCLVEMLTGQPPWSGDGMSLIYIIGRLPDKQALQEQLPEKLSRLSPPAKDLILRCFEVRRQDRPTARELLNHRVFSTHVTIAEQVSSSAAPAHTT